MDLKRRPDIERVLRQPGEARAALIHGRDLGVVRERAQILAAAVTARPDDPFDAALLTDDEADLDERLARELSAVSMMGGRRLVRLRLGGERAAKDRAAAEGKALEALAGHLKGEFNPDAFFLIEAWDVETTALARAAKASPLCAAIRCFSEEAGDLARLARERLALDKVALAPEALELFAARLPHDKGVAMQEIERLALFLGPGSNTVAKPADLDGFLGVEPEASLADAALDAFGGRLAAAHAGLRRAAQEGEGGPAAVRFLGLHLARLRQASVLRVTGASSDDIARSLRLFWKTKAEFLRQSRVWSARELDTVQPDILAADQACKTKGSPDQLLAERLALTIAGKARRLGL